MNKMLNKKDVLDAIEKKMKVVNEADGDADVVLGLAAAMSVVKKMEALEQEPCDDAISREDALMALTGQYADSLIEILPKAIKRINALPPVNPAEKVGRWVYNKNLSTYYGDVYTCSECGERCLESCYDHIDMLPNFCPKCHTKMEVEE